MEQSLTVSGCPAVGTFRPTRTDRTQRQPILAYHRLSRGFAAQAQGKATFKGRRMFRIGQLLTLLGSAAGIIATIALLTLPLMQYCGITNSSTGTAQGEVRCESSGLIESQGGRLEPVTWAYLITMTGLSVAAGVSAWHAERTRRPLPLVILVLGTVLGGGMLLAGFSIGFLYAPAVLFVEVGAVTILLAAKQPTTRPGSQA